MGASLSVTNKTDYNLHMSFNQVTPLYFENFVKPGETFTREVGKVWFTIEARIATMDNTYSAEKIILPITLLVLTGLLLTPIGAGIAAGIAAIAAANGGSVISSHGWYAREDRRFEVRQRLVDDIVRVDQDHRPVSYSSVADIYTQRFGNGSGKMIEFYLTEVFV